MLPPVVDAWSVRNGGIPEPRDGREAPCVPARPPLATRLLGRRLERPTLQQREVVASGDVWSTVTGARSSGMTVSYSEINLASIRRGGDRGMHERSERIRLAVAERGGHREVLRRLSYSKALLGAVEPGASLQDATPHLASPAGIAAQDSARLVPGGDLSMSSARSPGEDATSRAGQTCRTIHGRSCGSVVAG